MTKTVTLEQAQSQLRELVLGLSAGDQIVITANDKPIAEVRSASVKSVPQPGVCEGMILEYVDDDEHLKDWAEYMP